MAILFAPPPLTIIIRSSLPILPIEILLPIKLLTLVLVSAFTIRDIKLTAIKLKTCRRVYLTTTALVGPRSLELFLQRVRIPLALPVTVTPDFQAIKPPFTPSLLMSPKRRQTRLKPKRPKIQKPAPLYGPTQILLILEMGGTVQHGLEISLETPVAGLTILTMVGYTYMVPMRRVFGFTIKAWAGSTLEKIYSPICTEIHLPAGFMISQLRLHGNFGIIRV